MDNNKVSIVTIGDELLLGQIVDTNSAWLGQQLAQLDFEVVSRYVVQDDILDIQKALDQASYQADIIIVSGGLGPTSDDLTLEAVSMYFNMPLVEHIETRQRIESYFLKRGRVMSESHQKQFYLPQNARVLPNNVGTAPGLRLEKDGKIYFFVPGVPVEMKFLYENYIQVELNHGQSLHNVRYHLFTAGIGETSLVDSIKDELATLPSNIKMAYLPYHGGVRIRISGSNIVTSEQQSDLTALKQRIIAKLGEHFIVENHNDWGTIMAEVFLNKNINLSTAESCTGGYIAHKITERAGSSQYFFGSVVAYDNSVKQEVLKVNSETLSRYGAVSEPCAQEMLTGLLDLMGTDLGIVTTGIAGPDGGTEQKPVGTVFIGVGNKNQQIVQRFQFRSSRMGIIESTYHASMYMVYKFLSKQ